MNLFIDIAGLASRATGLSEADRKLRALCDWKLQIGYARGETPGRARTLSDGCEQSEFRASNVSPGWHVCDSFVAYRDDWI
jgi:hypothetical protein